MNFVMNKNDPAMMRTLIQAKKWQLLISILCLLNTQPIWATVHTVSNTGGSQFSDINAAVVAAAIGDTIYINGSSTSYTAPTTRKDDLTFVGAGFNPQNQNPLGTHITGSFFNVGNNNRIMAMSISCYINYVDGTSSLTIERCLLSNSLNSNGSLLCSNLVIRDCACSNLLMSGNKIPNCLISNTIFYKSISYGFFSSIVVDIRTSETEGTTSYQHEGFFTILIMKDFMECFCKFIILFFFSWGFYF